MPPRPIETSLNIPLGEVTLEARLALGSGGSEAGASGPLWLLGHPHPLYGGNMDNAVVLAARDAILAQGRVTPATTLRWNSRGVGRSTGSFGEGEDEAADLVALLALLGGASEAWGGSGPAPPLPADLSGPYTSIGLAGYSFGVFVALGALALGARPSAVMLFSPPLDFMSFEGLPPPDLPCLITLGDRDEYCSRSSLEVWLSSGSGAPQPTIRILRGVDHFYFGAERALEEAIGDFLSGR